MRSCNLSPKATMTELYGSSRVMAVPDLPAHLRQVYKRLKHFDPLGIDEWIGQHTFFHYYTTFAKKDVRDRVFTEMLEGTSPGSIHMMTGAMASSVSEPSVFRFCPKCADEDIQQYGEMYWHMSHQLPGVLVCPKHKHFLLNSSVSFRGKNKYVYHAATMQNCKRSQGLPMYSEKTIQSLLIIAKELIQLAHTDLSFTRSGVEQAYKYLLQRQGYATISGSVDQHTLAQQFSHFYGRELLEAVQSPIDSDNSSCWLKAITRKQRKAFHPIRHILLTHFLGESIDTFYRYESQTYDPFGSPPYPCLNPAADHYLQPVIPNVKETICTDTRKPVGTFTCSCGFIYSRRGPDHSIEDRYKIGRVKQFGLVWQDKVHDLIYIKKLSYYAAAKRLKVDIGTVKKYANQQQIAKDDSKEASTLPLESKRTQWLLFQEENSKTSVTEVRKRNPALYAWLYRHDRQWLQKHSSKINKTAVKNQRVNWTERDRQLVKEIKDVVHKLLKFPKPVRINRSRIGKEIGKLALLERHLEKLFQTNVYLNQVTESVEQFQIRRVRWAAKTLYNQHQDVVAWRIRRLAGLHKDIGEKVNREIDLQIDNYSNCRKEV
ncbi:TnsD family transposase [Sporolactobacillus sp. CPB3-1]|nr:TnsD family transposase [Sporolactobacillus mangiferae]